MNVIKPLAIARLTIEKSLLTYRMNFGQKQDAYPTIWFVEGPKEKVIVDAGADAKTLTEHGFPSDQIAYPDQALAKVGLKTSDIDILILTHMHFDHVEFLRHFNKAKIIVQRAEYEFAMNPHPMSAKGYVKEMFGDPQKYEIVEGDVEITKGVKVLFTPGHTPGGQSVAVITDKGIAIICGLCTIEDNLDPTGKLSNVGPVIPPGIHTNVIQAYDSLVRIKELADIAIPLHDGTFGFKQTIPW